MNLVRTEILDSFNLPELDISYWDFCIILAAVGIVATVLINSVRISGGSAASFSKERNSNSYGKYKEKRQRQEKYSKKYENGD